MKKAGVTGLILWLIALVCLLCFVTPAYTADEQEETPLLVWPMRLQDGWWDEFSKADPRQLKARIETAKSDLSFIKHPPEEVALVKQLNALFDQYYEKRTRLILPPDAKTDLKPAQRYSLEQVQRSVSERRKAQSELALSKSSREQLATELKAQKKAVTVNVILYKRVRNAENQPPLALLKTGLEQIRLQLNQAISSLNLSAVDQQIRQQQGLLGKLDGLEKRQIERLTVTKQEVTGAKSLLSREDDAIKRHEKRIASFKEQQLSTSAEPGNRGANLDLEQKILAQEAALRLSQQRRMGAELILDIETFSEKGGATPIDDARRDAIRQRMTQATSLLEDNAQWLDAAQARVAQEAELVDSIKDVVEKSGSGSRQQAAGRASRVATSKKALGALGESRADLQLLITIVDSKLSQTATGAEELVEKADDTLREGWGQFQGLMSAPLFELNKTPVDAYGLLNFLLIMLFGWLLTRLFRHAVKRVTERSKRGMQPASVATLSRIVSIFLMGIALLVGFSSLGIDVTKLALVASALSIGIGFGLQNIINNFVSGIILLFERSMKVGDYIELEEGLVGEVREINIRSTVITTNNNIDIIVPNSTFVNSNVINWTMTDGNLRVKLPFTVAYGSDKELLRKVILEAVLKQPYTLNVIDKHYPQLRLSGFGDNALDFDLVVWIKPGWSKRPGRVKAAYNWVIDDVLREYEFEVPFPQREVRVLHESVDQSVDGKLPDSQLDKETMDLVVAAGS